jgi:hypothetical protein
MRETPIISAVENLRVDALYGKKKHFNAADRKDRYNTGIGIFLIIMNVLIASNLFYTIQSDIRISCIIISLLGITATILACVQAFFNYSRTAEHHRTVATKYLHIVKECSRMKKYYWEGALAADDLIKRIDELAQKYEQITEDAISLSTSRKDYEMARCGINEGEESYSARDYNEEE